MFLERHLQVHTVSDGYEFFQRQWKIAEQKLQESQKRLEQFKAQNGVSALGEQTRLLLDQTARLETDLNETLGRQAEIDNRIAELKNQLKITPAIIPQGEELEHNPTIVSTLQGRLLELELQEKDLLSRYNEGSRAVTSVREEIRIVHEKLKEEEGKRHGRTRYGPNPTHQSLQAALFQNQAEMKATEARKSVQSQQLLEYQSRLDNLKAIESDLLLLQHEAEVNLENYRRYQNRLEESRISRAMDLDKIVNFSLIEKAKPPLKPNSPSKLLLLTMGAVLGLVGGLVIALALDYLQDTLERPEDVERALQLPVLASLPEQKPGNPQQGNTWGRFPTSRQHMGRKKMSPVIKDPIRDR